MEEKRSETVVPALPGWSVIYPVGEGGELELCEEPIIAWRIVISSKDEAQRRAGREIIHSDPITVEGATDAALAAIVRPDGTVTSPLVEEWKSREEYLAYVREQLAREAKKPKAI